METHAEQAQVKVQQRHEHEDQENPTPQLQEVLRRTLVTEGGDTCKHAASLPPALSQQEEEPPPQRQVPAGRRRQGFSTALIQNFHLKIIQFKMFSGSNELKPAADK